LESQEGEGPKACCQGVRPCNLKLGKSLTSGGWLDRLLPATVALIVSVITCRPWWHQSLAVAQTYRSAAKRTSHSQ